MWWQTAQDTLSIYWELQPLLHIVAHFPRDKTERERETTIRKTACVSKGKYHSSSYAIVEKVCIVTASDWAPKGALVTTHSWSLTILNWIAFIMMKPTTLTHIWSIGLASLLVTTVQARHICITCLWFVKPGNSSSSQELQGTSRLLMVILCISFWYIVGALGHAMGHTLVLSNFQF